MSNDKMTASWSARRSKRAVKPFDDGVGRLCGGNAVPGVRVRMYSDDDASRTTDFNIRTEDAVMLGEFLVAHGLRESITITMCVEVVDHAGHRVIRATELRAAYEDDLAGNVVVENKEDGQFLFSDDCARQLGRTLLVLAFPDDWHSSAPQPATVVSERRVSG